MRGLPCGQHCLKKVENSRTLMYHIIKIVGLCFGQSAAFIFIERRPKRGMRWVFAADSVDSVGLH
ncbi:MAG TPA: hypothetical protein DCY17_01980 [Clostridiales bacterium]|nr:hypothetical protein [Clostridiales bacterium]